MWEIERERAVNPTQNRTRNLQPWLGRNFHFRPLFWSSLVPIWSLEAGRRSPASSPPKTNWNASDRTLKTRDCFALFCQDFHWFWVAPPIGFYSSRIPLQFPTIHSHRESLFCHRSIVGIHDCRARFRRRCRALELTAGTIELSVIGTFRLELPS